jgi:hypothetical protein
MVTTGSANPEMTKLEKLPSEEKPPFVLISEP